MNIVEYNLDQYIIREYSNLHIFVVENVFDKYKCNQIISEIDNNIKSKRIKTTYNKVECYDAECIDIKLNEEIQTIMYELISKVASKHKIPNYDKTKIEYRKVYGETYEHTDGTCVDIIQDPITKYKLRSVRSLTCVCALNDNFEGGVHTFPKLNVNIKLKTGSVILFPPFWTHSHLVTKIEQNKYRYTISFWVLDNYYCNRDDAPLNNIIIL